MSKSADIGSKRLIGLAPTAWVQWLTGDNRIEAVELLSQEFQWVARANDVLIKAQSPEIGEFLVADEIQLRADKRIPRRIRAYAALAEERYDLPVFPVVLNILSTGAAQVMPSIYHTEVLGVRAYRGISHGESLGGRGQPGFRSAFDQPTAFVPIAQGRAG